MHDCGAWMMAGAQARLSERERAPGNSTWVGCANPPAGMVALELQLEQKTVETAGEERGKRGNVSASTQMLHFVRKPTGQCHSFACLLSHQHPALASVSLPFCAVPGRSAQFMLHHSNNSGLCAPPSVQLCVATWLCNPSSHAAMLLKGVFCCSPAVCITDGLPGCRKP